jgi:hypothetical protein
MLAYLLTLPLPGCPVASYLCDLAVSLRNDGCGLCALSAYRIGSFSSHRVLHLGSTGSIHRSAVDALIASKSVFSKSQCSLDTPCILSCRYSQTAKRNRAAEQQKMPRSIPSANSPPNRIYPITPRQHSR